MNSHLKSIATQDTSVLIVDDSTQYASVLERILKAGFGYQNVTVVASTGEAWKLLESAPDKFSLMFVDQNFPEGESGGELLSRLKNSHLMDQRVAFLISSEPTVENMKHAMSCGARGVLAKPFDRAELRKQLELAELSIKTDNSESF